MIWKILGNNIKLLKENIINIITFIKKGSGTHTLLKISVNPLMIKFNHTVHFRLNWKFVFNLKKGW